MILSENILIGTSGWHYKHWRDSFYGKNLNKEEWLAYYAKQFSTVEINNSFYRLPDQETLSKWRECVPAEFVFSVKASRYITHMKKLKEVQEALDSFLRRIEEIGEKLGPVIFQLPPRWRCNRERLAAFLKLLSGDFRYAFEFRHDSWWDEAVYQLLSEYNIAFCIYQLDRRMSPKKRTADFVYVRLHGPDAAYQGSYDEQTLAGWAGTFLNYSKDCRQIFCYFDNDQYGYAVRNAHQLKKILTDLDHS